MKPHWDRRKFNEGNHDRIPVKEVLVGKKWIKKADYLHKIRKDIDVYSKNSKARGMFYGN